VVVVVVVVAGVTPVRHDDDRAPVVAAGVALVLAVDPHLVAMRVADVDVAPRAGHRGRAEEQRGEACADHVEPSFVRFAARRRSSFGSVAERSNMHSVLQYDASAPSIFNTCRADP
jgi:hypothetical protein